MCASTVYNMIQEINLMVWCILCEIDFFNFVGNILNDLKICLFIVFTIFSEIK